MKVVKTWTNFSRTRVVPPRKFPLYLHGITIPENCTWSFNKPAIGTKYSIGIVYKTFCLQSTSQLNKSALIRGRKYILSGKLSKIKYCTLERSFIAKASFSSSFKGQVNKEHKTFIEIGKGYIRGQCSCKNGKWKCAHQASLLFQTLCEMKSISPQEIFKFKKREKIFNLIITKRK